MREYFLWLAKVITVATVVVAVVAVIGAIKAGRTSTGIDTSKHRVGVVELSGVIVDPKDVIDRLHTYATDDDLHGIVLRIDSPGGAVGPSQEIFQAVRNVTAKKPVVASMGSVAASGGLYASLGAAKVFAQPGSLTGSIGVIVQIPNLAQVTESLGISMITVKSGKFKDVGNSFREMSEEERAFLQATIDSVHQQFIKDLTEARKLSPEAVAGFADGRVLTGARARELGLVDDFGGVREAARAVFDILGKPLAPDEEPELVYTEDRFAAFAKLFEAGEAVTRVVHGFRPTSMQLMYLMQ